MQNIRILNASEVTTQDYKALRLEALKEEPQAFGDNYAHALEKPDAEWIQRIAEAEEEKTDIMLFAECDEKLVGMIGAYFNKTPETQSKAHIWGMYVNKKYRGKGIGKLLIQKVVEKLTTVPNVDRVKLMVNVDQQPALKLYESLGFAIVGKDQLQMGDGNKHKVYIMERVL